jgi:hypothetical protein
LIGSQLMFRRNIPPTKSGPKKKPSKNQHELSRVNVGSHLQPWRWRRYVPPKRQLTTNQRTTRRYVRLSTCFETEENQENLYADGRSLDVSDLFRFLCGARGSVVGSGTILQTGRYPIQVPEEVDIFNWPNPSSRAMGLGSTQPLTEMSTRNLSVGKKRQACRADNLAAVS